MASNSVIVAESLVSSYMVYYLCNLMSNFLLIAMYAVMVFS